MADYKIKNLYQGGYSAFEPQNSYSNSGSFGLTTNPQVANILSEASTKLSSGVKHIELTLLNPQIVDSIPKQQMKEIKRLGEVTGVSFSVHGPVVNPTGANPQHGFDELDRQASERRIIETLERSHEIDPKGNIPVVFHSGEGIPGSEWKTLGEGRKAQRIIAVERESGKMMPINEETIYQPGMKDLKPGVEPEKYQEYLEGKIPGSEIFNKIPLMDEQGKLIGSTLSPEEGLRSASGSTWDNEISQLKFTKQQADAILEQSGAEIQHLLPLLEKARQGEGLDVSALEPSQLQAYNHYNNAKSYLENLDKSVRAKFSKAFKLGNEHQKNELKKLNEVYSELIKGKRPDIFTESKAMQMILDRLDQPDMVPEMFVTVEDYAVEKSAQTFGNAAFAGYKKFKDTAPIINIENPPSGIVLSNADDLKNLVEKSREQFVEKAKQEGMSEGEAREQAEKLIGATWDVGNINMIRGKGFKEEDVIKETERIAPYVKHVHLSDNFGMEHTELPMGMGNVPMKKIMEKLGEKGYEAKKIIEAGNWWQHFKTPPFQETLEAFGSPVYDTGKGPYWSQAPALQEGYLGGYGKMLPETHYETFGGGFTSLPTELGGSKTGAPGSRMSGRGME